MQRIAQALAAQDNNVRIEGHTDNVPIHNAHFASNWELDRPSDGNDQVVHYPIRISRHPPFRCRVRGVSSRSDMNTAEGRAQNRRVDIVVLASTPEAAEASKQKAEGSEQKAEGSKQKAEGSKQKAEGSKQKAGA